MQLLHEVEVLLDGSTEPLDMIPNFFAIVKGLDSDLAGGLLCHEALPWWVSKATSKRNSDKMGGERSFTQPRNRAIPPWK